VQTDTPYSVNHNALATNGVGQDDQAQALALGDTYLFGAETVNSFRISGTRVGARTIGAIPFTPKDMGMNFYSYYGFVPILMAGVGFNLNEPTNFAVGDDAMSSFGANDNLSLVRGSHQLSFGGSVSRSLLNAHSFAWSEGVDLNPAIWLGKPIIVSPTTAAQFGQCAALQADCGGKQRIFGACWR
jgi:hypothetical protein